jgi:hypothetical protein
VIHTVPEQNSYFKNMETGRLRYFTFQAFFSSFKKYIINKQIAYAKRSLSLKLIPASACKLKIFASPISLHSLQEYTFGCNSW